MSTLFLTSSANQILDSLLDYLPAKPSDLSVAFIPTASYVYKKASWVSDDRNKLIALGFQVKDVDISKRTVGQLSKDLDTDVIFVAGGNTFYLLQELNNSGAGKLIKAKVASGTIYIGSSAGSLVASASIELVKELDHPKKAPNLKSYKALGLTDVFPLVHFGHPLFHSRYLLGFDNLYTTQGKYICIRDNQALIISNNTFKLI